jgi:hypothetical protein
MEEEEIMARIPLQRGTVVERQKIEPEHGRGLALWVWPLIPLILGALALGLSLKGDDNDRGMVVTDMPAVADDADQSKYVNQNASFANVTVQSVVGDRGFWIGPDTSRQLFVVIDENNAGKSDNIVQVVPGQVLTVSGQLEKLPPLDQAPAEWGLDASSSAALANQQVYLHATHVAGQ